MAIALARRYRPRRFSDLLVQDHVAAVLRGAIQNDRVGHGYLLTGPRGVGKTTAARILAMALNCPRREPTGDPCGECESCLRIWNGSASLDVVEIDAASNRGVDDARELRERAMYAPSEEKHYKVYIVDEAHMLTREAWNALLKVLEEPPPRVVFVFATTDPQKIAATAAPVLSRLQRFDFRRIGPAAIRERLRGVLAEEGVAAEEDALTLIARHADGGMRDALSVLDQCLSFGEGVVTAERVRETLGLVSDELYAEMLGMVVRKDPAGVFALVERLMDSGADLGEFMTGAAELLRALLMVQVGAEPEGMTEAMRGLLTEYRDELKSGDVLRMLRLLTDNETAIRRSSNSRLVVETLLLRWAMLDRIIDLEEVLRGGSGGGGTPPRAVPAVQPGSGAVPVDRRSEPRAGARPSPAPATSPSPRPEEPRAEPAPPPAAPVPDTEPVPFTLDALRAAWPSIIAAVRNESRFLGEALASTDPAAVAAPDLSLTMREPNPILHERLEQQAAMVERVVQARVGAPVRLRLVADVPEGPPAESPKRRMSESGIRAARLKGLRERDPALDTAADELDLEIVE